MEKVLMMAPLAMETNISALSDGELLQKCNQYGLQARMWRDRFLGLLPEVARRELFRAKGFESIVEFARIIGGVSEKQVGKVLNTEAALQDKPQLLQMLVGGKISMNKLATISSVATPANEEYLASQVKLLPKAALETLARDMRSYQSIITNNNQNNGNEGANQNKNTSTQLSFAPGGNRTTSLQLDENIEEQLLELQQKGIDINTFLQKVLDERKTEIQQKKEIIAQEMTKRDAEKASTTPSRHIPQKIKTLLAQEYGTKCAVPTCRKPSEEIHHTARYELLKREAPNSVHNPLFLAPLCKPHHKIAHSIDVNYQEKREL